VKACVPVQFAAKRMMLVLIVTCVVDATVAWFVPHPFLWCMFIGASIPVSTSIFVLRPMTKKAEQIE